MLHLLSSVSNCQQMPNTGSNKMCSVAGEEESPVSDAGCPSVPGPSKQVSKDDDKSTETKERRRKKKTKKKKTPPAVDDDTGNEMCGMAVQKQSSVSDAGCPGVPGPSKQVSKNKEAKERKKKEKTPSIEHFDNIMCCMTVEQQSSDSDAGCPGVSASCKQVSNNVLKSTEAKENKKKKKQPLGMDSTRNAMCSMAVEQQSVPDAGCPGVPVPGKQISKNEDKSTVALEKKKKKKKPLCIHNTRWSSKQKFEHEVSFPSVVDADEPDEAGPSHCFLHNTEKTVEETSEKKKKKRTRKKKLEPIADTPNMTVDLSKEMNRMSLECSERPHKNNPDTLTQKIVPKKKSVKKSEVKEKENRSAKCLINAVSGAFCNLQRPDVELHQMERKRGAKNRRRQSNSTFFEPHWSLEEVEAGVLKGEIVMGNIRVNPRRYKEAYISVPGERRDILIDDIAARNRAFEGDYVAVQIYPREKWKEGPDPNLTQKTGQVVCILDYVHTREYVGRLEFVKGNKYPTFHPRNQRLPRLRITNWNDEDETDSNKIYVAKQFEWNYSSYGLGYIVEELGSPGDMSTEKLALIRDNNLRIHPYPEELLKYIITQEIDANEMKHRRDLRQICIFTIDPLTARDLDDALSFEKLPNGNFRIGVHISDVSHCLVEDTPLDLEAAKRATTVYLVEKAYHMLPIGMCLDCSLTPGEDKFAFSSFWEMTQEGKIVAQEFTTSVINSCVKLAYEHAQMILDDPEKQWQSSDLPPIYGDFTPDDICKSVKDLYQVSKLLSKQRMKKGVLHIDQLKLTINLDPDSGLPIGFTPTVMNESNRLVQEFMLLANIEVAKVLKNKFPDLALLRCHPPPKQHQLDVLQARLDEIGIKLNVSSPGDFQKTLDQYREGNENIVLTYHCTKPMMRAKYICASKYSAEQQRHYALNENLYTHFTSPIRRYADIMVHRLLKAALELCPMPNWTSDHVERIAATCNRNKAAAKNASEQSTLLYMAMFIQERNSIEEPAVVVEVKDSSFDIITINLGFTHRIYINKMLAKVNYCKDTSSLHVTWFPTVEDELPIQQVIRVLTVVMVELSVSEDDSMKIKPKLLRPRIEQNFN